MKIKKIFAVLLAVLLVVAMLNATGCKEEKRATKEANNQISGTEAKLLANANPASGFFETQADSLRTKILNTANTETLYQITGTKYYISSSEGDDNNDGLSPKTPFKTLTALKELYTVDGDAILFKRGDTFRFGETLKVRNSITYGAYGTGEKPKIYASPENYGKSDKWENEMGNIWKIAFDYPEACGVVINSSEIIGINKSKGIKTLTSNGDYFHDTENGVFYLYCDKGNPSKAYTDIEIMPSTTLIKLPNSGHDIVIDNLCLKYTSGFAIRGTTPKRITVTNCEIGFIGGKWFGEGHTLRYGNAIEFWNSAKDIKVENNWIYQTYDSAFSWQGNKGGSYQNISLTGNLFEYNNADIEFFDRNGSTVENFTVKNNFMRFTSMGWGTRKEDGGIRGIEGVLRAVTNTRGESKAVNIKSIYFTDNTIDCPARQTINWNTDPEQFEFIHASGTKLYIKGEYRTLDSCLQGLQTNKDQAYDQRFANNYEELVEGFKIFEQNAEIFWK